MLYHFQLELSDVDRGIYESLDFRIVQHPSESTPYLLTRALAYALSYQDGLEFSPVGLGDPEAPAILSKNALGDHNLWIEIGNPSARKLHKASKAARTVLVYTYKNPEVLLKEITTNDVHRAREIQIFALDAKFLTALEEVLKKNNRWTLLIQQGQLDVGTGAQDFHTEVKRFQVAFPD